MKYPAYPKYKPSGVECLGDVPAHWKVWPLGRIGNFRKGNGGTKEDQVSEGVPCIRYGHLYTHYNFLIRESRWFVSPERAAAYTPIRHGDMLFAGSGETIDEIDKSAVNLIETEAVCGGDVIVFRPGIEVDARFMGYATDCRSAAFQKSCLGRGITVMHIYADELKYLRVALPPLPEQTAIADFLDAATGKIDRLVAKKRALIALLQEKRRALISRCVTRGLPPESAQAAGLDPHPKLKPSGIPWLGAIPEHWETPPLRARYRVVLGKMLNENRITGEFLIPYLRNVDVQWDSINFDDLPEMDIKPNELERFCVREGDLVTCEGGEVGRSAIVGHLKSSVGFQKAIHRLRPTSECEVTRFLYYTFCAAANIGEFTTGGNPNTIPHLTGEKLRRYRFPTPPKDEQAAIAHHLDVETEKLNELLAKIESAIDRLQEYRTALITATVTGKIDVRQAAANANGGELEAVNARQSSPAPSR